MADVGGSQKDCASASCQNIRVEEYLKETLQMQNEYAKHGSSKIVSADSTYLLMAIIKSPLQNNPIPHAGEIRLLSPGEYINIPYTTNIVVKLIPRGHS